jgi:Xaa-Pro aminopeptidase
MKFDRIAQLDEVSEKKVRLQRLMEDNGFDAVVLTRRHNFSWATGGSDNHVRHSSEFGVATLVFFRDGRRVVLTSNIEAPRIGDEELGGLGFEMRSVRWYKPEERAAALAELLNGARVASDDGTPNSRDIEPFMPPLRMRLTAHETEKYRWLGKQAGLGIAETCKKVKKGMTEEEVAGILFAECSKRGAKPTVMLIAADDRISRYRHPIPTTTKVKNAVMVVLCARRWGLVCSATRLVRFGAMPPELKRRHEACVHIDATMMSATMPGVAWAEVFRKAQADYASQGFPDEWQNHHQGGPTGYIEREFTATPGTAPELKAEAGNAVAWNPSIAGTKSEDTMLVTARGPEIITASPGWPMLAVTLDNRKTIRRPNWLVKGA